MSDWRSRVWQAFRAGNLTRAARDALLTLATFRGTVAWPTHRMKPWPSAPGAAYQRCSGH
jgi:hypothetical protein